MAKPLTRITLLDVVKGVEAGPQPSVLVPVRASHRAAIAKINRLCARDAKRFAADLRRVKLADLGDKKPRRRRLARESAK